jgi:hypothetical protein
VVLQVLIRFSALLHQPEAVSGVEVVLTVVLEVLAVVVAV